MPVQIHTYTHREVMYMEIHVHRMAKSFEMGVGKTLLLVETLESQGEGRREGGREGGREWVEGGMRGERGTIRFTNHPATISPRELSNKCHALLTQAMGSKSRERGKHSHAQSEYAAGLVPMADKGNLFTVNVKSAIQCHGSIDEMPKQERDTWK